MKKIIQHRIKPSFSAVYSNTLVYCSMQYMPWSCALGNAKQYSVIYFVITGCSLMFFFLPASCTDYQNCKSLDSYDHDTDVPALSSFIVQRLENFGTELLKCIRDHILYYPKLALNWFEELGNDNKDWHPPWFFFKNSWNAITQWFWWNKVILSWMSVLSVIDYFFKYCYYFNR